MSSGCTRWISSGRTHRATITGDDGNAVLTRARQLVEAESVRPANGVRSHQQQEAPVRMLHPVDAALDRIRPIQAGPQALLVEPQLVTARHEIVADSRGERDVPVMAVAQKNPQRLRGGGARCHAQSLSRF